VWSETGERGWGRVGGGEEVRFKLSAVAGRLGLSVVDFGAFTSVYAA
jgi:hypothetical protein